MAISVEQLETKEVTILEQSEVLLKLCQDFQNKLDSRFNRVPRPEKGQPLLSQEPNVLDEILNNLHIGMLSLREIEKQISMQVLPKIN